MNKKGIVPGLIIGSLATAGAVVGSALTYHHKVIQPIDQEEDRIEENRRKANRKAHSAHIS